jgi:hypothetical protein
MRPKVALFTLLVGIGVVALFVVLKGISSKPDEPATPMTNAEPVKAASAQGNPAVTSIIATTPTEDLAAQKQKDLEAIRDALLTGGGDAQAVVAIGDRLFSLDSEVRVAARQAAMHLDDTNLIPYLTAAAEQNQDPREKVALLDALDFLKLAAATELATTNGMDPRLLNTPSVEQPAPTNGGWVRRPNRSFRAPGSTPGQPTAVPPAAR